MMENPELSQLLTKTHLFFQWSEGSHSWQLSHQQDGGGYLEGHQREAADNLESAQFAAIQVLLSMRLAENFRSRESPELESLLNKYRLTFHWGNPGLRWWLVGQNKGSNTLLRTAPRPARDLETAKADAVEYIMQQYTHSAKESGS
jgi:hypothetical protein